MTVIENPGMHALIVATSQLPISNATDPLLGRAYPALMQTVASSSGAWVAATDQPAAGTASSWLRPLHIPATVLSAHRDGHCATTLARVYFGHQSATPTQEPAWRIAFEHVNAKYAATIAEHTAPGATVWVHGYPLQLVPGMLRRLRPDLRIGFSLHSPFPPAESFLALAGREDLLAGLAAADLVSFQDQRSVANFTSLTTTLTTGCTLPATTVMPMPADTQAVAHLAASPAVAGSAARIRAALRPASTIFLSTGGHDSGDGTLQALQEFARLLATGQLDPQRHVLIHLAPAGDDATAEARQAREATERITAQINGRHGRPGHCPVHYQRADFTAAEMAAFYLAADVILATPLRDRATPHAAEYAAARTDGRGRIIASEFSATAAQLPGLAVINPHEPAALGQAMLAAAGECRSPSPAMIAIREHVLAYGISGWAQQFLRLLTTGRQPATPEGERGLATAWRQKSIRHNQEGLLQRGQASDVSSQLTVAAPHP